MVSVQTRSSPPTSTGRFEGRGAAGRRINLPAPFLHPASPGFIAHMHALTPLLSPQRSELPRQPARRNASPPLVFQGFAGGAGLVKAVELGYVLIGERKVEDLSILFDAFSVRRFRKSDEVMLEAPPQQYLGGCPTDSGCNPVHGLVPEV